MAAAQPPLQLNVSGLGAPRRRSLASFSGRCFNTGSTNSNTFFFLDNCRDSGVGAVQECSRGDHVNASSIIPHSCPHIVKLSHTANTLLVEFRNGEETSNVSHRIISL